MQVITRSPRRMWILVAVIVVAGAAIYWFGPWHLFIDRRVNEALPGVPATEDVAPGDDVVPAEDADVPPADGAGDEAPAEPAPEIVTLAEGSFRSLAHSTSGTAAIVELADGRRFVRFEDLDTDSGPDLRVYLSEASAGGEAGAIDDAFVDLGALKGNQGNQNYAIPGDVDLDDVMSVSVWCRRFSVGFGVAPLVVA